MRILYCTEPESHTMSPGPPDAVLSGDTWDEEAA